MLFRPAIWEEITKLHAPKSVSRGLRSKLLKAPEVLCTTFLLLQVQMVDGGRIQLALSR